MAKVITVFNQKGGVGKTTIAVHIAGVLARDGYRVLLVDADKQGTALTWVSNAEEGSELPMRTANLASAGRKLHTQIRPYLEDNDYIVIDCPPATNAPCTQSALLVADLAILPLTPSPADLWASVGAEELLESAKAVNEDLIAVAIWNQFDKRRLLTQGAKDVLSEMSVIPMRTTLKHRESFRKAIAMGGLVHDVPDPAAVFEINKMIKEILSFLDGSE